jgi:hypothetical protein
MYLLHDRFPEIPDGFRIRVSSIEPHAIIWYCHSVSLESANLDTLSWCRACRFDEEITMFWVLKYGKTLPFKYMDLGQYT